MLPPPDWNADYSPLIARLWDDGTLHLAHMATGIGGVTHFCLKQTKDDPKPTLEVTLAVTKETEDKGWWFLEQLKKLPIKTVLKIEEVE